MKSKALSVYQEIMETLSFVKFECADKKLSSRLCDLVQQTVLSQWVNAIDGEYCKIFAELLPVDIELLFNKLKIVTVHVCMYKREYVGHAAKVAPFIKHFENIEPSLSTAQSFMQSFADKRDLWDEKLYGQLRTIIGDLELCKECLQKQYDLWRHEVKADKKSGWFTMLWTGALAAVMGALIAKVLRLTDVYVSEPLKNVDVMNIQTNTSPVVAPLDGNTSTPPLPH